MRVRGPTPLPRGVRDDAPETLIATWFGVGLIRTAPGTWGSLAALPVGLVAVALGGPVVLSLVAITVAVAGIWAAERLVARIDREVHHDLPIIVVDEVAGMLIALIPAGFSPVLWLLAFFVFRVLDIFKPWPISVLDRRVKGGLGIMVDDIAAGVITAALVYAATPLLAPWL